MVIAGRLYLLLLIEEPTVLRATPFTRSKGGVIGEPSACATAERIAFGDKQAVEPRSVGSLIKTE